MANGILKLACRNRACMELTDSRSGYCPECEPDANREDRERRGSANERGYTYRWQRESKQFLFANPLCAHCEAEGRVKPADLVDHVTPHRGDMVLFWDRSNWQGLCTYHHGVKTAKGE